MKEILRIVKTSKKLWPLYTIVSITSIIAAILNLLLPLLTGRAIDEIRLGDSSNVKFAAMLAFAVFAVDIGGTIVNNIGGYFGDQIDVRLQKLLSDKYFAHLMLLPQSFFDTELSGKIINRLNRSIVQISNFMHMMSNSFLQFIFSTIFSLIVIAIFSWPIALMLGALYPIYIYMTIRTSDTWLKYQQQKNRHTDIASGRFAEAISQMKVVKSFNQEKREKSFFAKHFSKVTSINMPQSRYWHTQDVKRRVVLNFIFLGVYSFIFIQGVNGVFTPGQAVTLILYAMQIRIPIFTISFLVENTQKAVADSRDYFEVLEQKPHHKENIDNPKLKISKGKIELKNVSFAYSGDKHVLNEITATIEPNQTTAFVGESGGGKTTVTNLLMRLYDPSAGEVKIDGTNINKVTLASLRDSIGVVFQDPSLFSGTIRENISYSNPDATFDEIKRAAKAANADEFIRKLDNQYDCEIGEHGLKLSGGQKQRIAIARALLKNAPILILDEATSSLDNKSEQLVQSALSRLMKNRTTIIIAHRLSTIQNADQIITIIDGEIGEIGSPAKLAKSDGIYSQLLKLQGSTSEKDKNKLRTYDIASK